MKNYRFAIVVACVTLSGQASAQPLPQGQTVPAPVRPQDLPPLPIADPLTTDATILQGTWQVKLTDVEPSKEARWIFADKSVTFKEGATMSVLPFQLQQNASQKAIVFQLPGQKLTGTYTLVDNDTIFVRLRQPGAAGSGFSMFVLVREPAIEGKKN
jgi:hypothetical protein